MDAIRGKERPSRRITVRGYVRDVLSLVLIRVIRYP